MKKQRFWCQVFKRCSFIIRIYMLEKLHVAKFHKIIKIYVEKKFFELLEEFTRSLRK